MRKEHRRSYSRGYKGRKENTNRNWVLAIVLFVSALCTANIIVMRVTAVEQEKAKVVEVVNKVKAEKAEFKTEFILLQEPEISDVENEEVIVTEQPTSEESKIVEVFNQLSIEEQEMIKQSMSYVGPKDEYVIIVSERSRQCMEWVTYNESRGEPFDGQVAVAAVILNRFMNKEYDGMTIEEICSKPWQFAFSEVSEDDLLKTRVKEAVDQALRGYDPTRQVFSQGARFFYNPEFSSPAALESRQGIKELVIGAHHFHNDFSK